MKKFFTLSMLFVLVASLAQAQGYRKWDFSSWSPTTVANLVEEATKGQLGGSWSDIEKSTDGATTPGGNVCFWSYGDNVIDGELAANGAVIAETAGLLWNTAYTSRRSLALAVDYPTALGDYAGPQYLWLGGGNAKSASARLYCFIIPKVRIGQKITIVAESHKPSDARGVALYAGACTDDANQIGEAFKPTTQASYTWEDWTLPEGATTNDDGTVDIQVYNTNGCHLYSIEVGTADQKSKVAYIYNGTIGDEAAFNAIKASEAFTAEAVEATAAFTLDALKDYSALVLSPNLNNADAIASLKDIRPFMPVLNLNPALYEAWGMGTTADSGTPFANVTTTANHALFRGLDVIDADGILGLELTAASYKTVSPTGVFADDQVLATAMASESTAIHAHNLSHNGYLYIPAFDKAPGLLDNAVSILANSKADVTAAPKPTITQSYKNMETLVTIKSGVPSAEIFYTTDGSEPTTSSTRYTEPFSVTAANTVVKAVAQGDGYLLSDVAEVAIELKEAGPVPTINVEQKGNESIVTLACSNPDVSIFYNYEALNDSTKSTKYTGPITLVTNKTISAFTASQSLVPSDLAQQDVTIEKPIVFTEVISHMDANKQEYYQNYFDSEDKPNGDSNSKVAYFFSWGKSKTAYPYYDTTAEPISTTTDPETGDEVNVYPMSPEEKYDFGTGWAIRSRGQVICTEVTIKPGKTVGDGSSYNPATVDEFELQDQYPATDYYVNISEWNTNAGEPRSGMIYSTQKFKGPFAVLAYISNGNGGTGPKCVFETGSDIEGDAMETEWNQMGDSCILNKGQRLYQKFLRIYNGTDEVYLRTRIADGGSKAGYYDIYVLGVEAASLSDGIEEVTDNAGTVRSEAVYSIDGMRLPTTQRGLNIVRRADGTTRKVMVK